VIDNLRRVNRLLVKLEESLPIAANMTAQLAATVRQQSSGGYIPRQCEVTAVHYLGDEGGIICRLDLRGGDGRHGFLASITHLEFDPRQPCADEIAAYQKHRIKRLRQAALRDLAKAG
jgi:hypothetical protein